MKTNEEITTNEIVVELALEDNEPKQTEIVVLNKNQRLAVYNKALTKEGLNYSIVKSDVE